MRGVARFGAVCLTSWVFMTKCWDLYSWVLRLRPSDHLLEGEYGLEVVPFWKSPLLLSFCTCMRRCINSWMCRRKKWICSLHECATLPLLWRQSDSFSKSSTSWPVFKLLLAVTQNSHKSFLFSLDILVMFVLQSRENAHKQVSSGTLRIGRYFLGTVSHQICFHQSGGTATAARRSLGKLPGASRGDPAVPNLTYAHWAPLQSPVFTKAEMEISISYRDTDSFFVLLLSPICFWGHSSRGVVTKREFWNKIVFGLCDIIRSSTQTLHLKWWP